MELVEKKTNKHIVRSMVKRGVRGFVSKNNKHTKSKYKRNGKKNNLNKVKSAYKSIKIVAPTLLDLYSPKNNFKVIEFMSEIESSSKSASLSHNKKIHICFRNTIFISAAACLWMLSKMETIRSLYPNVKYALSRPPVLRAKNSYDKKHIVDSVLNRTGFYSALGINKRNMKEVPDVKCWEVIRGELVESEVVGGLLECVADKVGQEYTDLYRPVIEAMSNSVEHAYRKDIYKPKGNGNTNKWWCLAAILNNRLVVLVCDLGVGIPKTLRLTQGEGFLSKIVEFLGKPLTTDSDHIKAALQVKRTRTRLGYRGKGGTDLQSVIDSYKDSMLRIISNHGNYGYTNRSSVAVPEIMWDGKLSIDGTIVEWSMPLQAEGSKE